MAGSSSTPSASRSWAQRNITLFVDGGSWYAVRFDHRGCPPREHAARIFQIIRDHLRARLVTSRRDSAECLAFWGA
jgi:hypothetical protein